MCPQGKNRRRQFHVRATDEEMWVIRAAANAVNLSVSGLFRRLLLDDQFRRDYSGYAGALSRHVAQRVSIISQSDKGVE